jgi:hypothetical protein
LGFVWGFVCCCWLFCLLWVWCFVWMVVVCGCWGVVFLWGGFFGWVGVWLDRLCVCGQGCLMRSGRAFDLRELEWGLFESGMETRDAPSRSAGLVQSLTLCRSVHGSGVGRSREREALRGENVGGTHAGWRRVLSRLGRRDRGRLSAPPPGMRPVAVCVFPGQGSQRVGMARDWWRRSRSPGGRSRKPRTDSAPACRSSASRDPRRRSGSPRTRSRRS